MMYSIRGKLDNGNTVSGTVAGDDAGKALASVTSNLPAGVALASVTVKQVDGGSLKIGKPRAKKGAAAPADASAPAPKSKK